MRLNLFKAARRTALALCVSWVGGCAVYGIFAKPHAYLTYSVNALDAAPTRVPKCGVGDGSRIMSMMNVGGGTLGVTLCFKTLKAEERQWWMEASYSLAVARQMDAFEERFRVPPPDLVEVASLHREHRLEQWRFAAIAATSVVVGGWALVTVVGLVVRSIYGIPRGKDSRHRLPTGATASSQHNRYPNAGTSTRVKRRTKSRLE